MQITLHEALVSQRAQFPQLPQADSAAGGRELADSRFAGDFLVERNQFAQFVARSVNVSALDGRQLDGQQDGGVVSRQKPAERR